MWNIRSRQAFVYSLIQAVTSDWSPRQNKQRPAATVHMEEVSFDKSPTAASFSVQKLPNNDIHPGLLNHRNMAVTLC